VAVRLERIDSLEDPRVALYRNLKDADLRRRDGLFMAEGRLVVETLIEFSRFRADSILLTPAVWRLLEPLCERLEFESPVYLAEQEVLDQVVGFNLHRGCLAVGRVGTTLLPAELLKEPIREPSTLVALEGLTNTENVGTVFRNAIAFAVDGVVLCPRCADPLYRRSIRVSMGGSLCVPFARASAWPDVLDELRSAGYRVLALDPGPKSIELHELPSEVAQSDRVAWLLGTEGKGVSEAALERVDWSVRIPMASDVDSINVGTASGIAFHHLYSRRGPGERGR
jgi:tRNA G18 (ribose-2'-O)-methylase SpoU